MTDDDVDPPTTGAETEDDAGDDEAVDDGGDLGATDTSRDNAHASDDPQGIVGEEA